MSQAGTPISIQISLELCAFDELELALDVFLKSVGVANVVQNGEEDNQQLFIEVELPSFIDRLQIDGLFALHNSSFSADGASPVNFVVAGM